MPPSGRKGLRGEAAQIAAREVMSAAQLQQRVSHLADQIAADYPTQKDPLVVVCLLNGAYPFTADLARALSSRGVRTHIDFICVSSYESEDDEEVRVLMDLRSPVRGRDLLLCVDVCETGRTLHFLQMTFGARMPRSLRTAVLFDKPQRRAIGDLRIDYVAAKADNVFLVGYGIGLRERYRGLPNVVSLRSTLRRKLGLIPDRAQDQKPALADVQEDAALARSRGAKL
eukprot:TRINITY_DN3969_c0_g5_i1.p2 TRINITY_DN3969_c0_g5~~TRINITY_DN3969_c0_g5_i1.p2  ORF type:complete len:263 (+),score=69.92 TRINITY_DN3969_c0_g5_i1:107-790(+)